MDESSSLPSGVTAPPNESQIRGEIVNMQPTADGIGTEWEVNVKQARDVAGLKNLAKSQEGQTIRILVAPDTVTHAKVRDEVDARVTYQGDDSDGAYFLLDHNLTTVPPQ